MGESSTQWAKCPAFPMLRDEESSSPIDKCVSDKEGEATKVSATSASRPVIGNHVAFHEVSEW